MPVVDVSIDNAGVRGSAAVKPGTMLRHLVRINFNVNTKKFIRYITGSQEKSYYWLEIFAISPRRKEPGRLSRINGDCVWGNPQV
jgi:hypothetical protein